MGQTKKNEEISLKALCTQACFKSKREETLYLDKACVRHMAGDKSMFSCLTSIESDTAHMRTIGKVKLLVKVTLVQVFKIHNLLIVDCSNHNLLINELYDKREKSIKQVFHSKC